MGRRGPAGQPGPNATRKRSALSLCLLLPCRWRGQTRAPEGPERLQHLALDVQPLWLRRWHWDSFSEPLRACLGREDLGAQPWSQKGRRSVGACEARALLRGSGRLLSPSAASQVGDPDPAPQRLCSCLTRDFVSRLARPEPTSRTGGVPPSLPIRPRVDPAGDPWAGPTPRANFLREPVTRMGLGPSLSLILTDS